jgi:hypothetical protein
MIPAVDNNGQEENTIKGLHNVKEYSRAHSFTFKRFFNDVSDMMYLVNIGMVISDSKLMCWHQMFFVDNRFETLSTNFSNNLDIIGNNEIGRYDPTSLRF